MTELRITLTDAPDLEIGSRVGVFASYLTAPDGRNTLKFYGWGTYEGDFPIGEPDSSEQNQTRAEKKAFFNKTQKACNPRIRMDDGTVTWGALVWFDSEEYIQSLMKHADLVVTLDLASRMEVFNFQHKHLLEYVEASAKVNSFSLYES